MSKMNVLALKSKTIYFKFCENTNFGDYKVLFISQLNPKILESL